jgi:predicted dienelactone hydrolase
LGTASTGARGKSMGSVAASWKPTTRARGLQPSRSAACDVISTRAAAASFRVEALPAVTVPFSFCEAHEEVTAWFTSL